MSSFTLDGPADAKKELLSLLDYNGISYVSESDGSVRFLFSDKGFKWETVCRATNDGAVVIYGIYPFAAANESAALRLCGEVNACLRYGGMFLQNGQIVFRTGADLFDIYSAYETIGRALEYNAGVIVEFWERMAFCREPAKKDMEQIS